MTVYYSAAESGPTVDDAQKIIAAHAVIVSTNRCRLCGVENCHLRLIALRVLAEYGALPRRQPGATQPERLNLRRVRPR